MKLPLLFLPFSEFICLCCLVAVSWANPHKFLAGKNIGAPLSKLTFQTTVTPLIYPSARHFIDLCDPHVLSERLVPHNAIGSSSSSSGSTATSDGHCGVREKRKNYTVVRNSDLLPKEDLVDIIFIMDSKDANPASIFELWREAVIGYHIIIFCIDDLATMDIPSWVTSWELFTFTNMKNAFRSDLMDGVTPMPNNKMKFLLDKPGNGIAIRNFATWLSTRRFVYVIDSDAVGSHECKPRMDVISQHLINVMSASVIPVCNKMEDSLTYDEQVEHIMRSSKKHLTQTAMSIGLTIKDGDGLPPNSVLTLPQNILLNAPMINTMYNRKLMGAALFYISPDDDYYGAGFSKYASVISTWIMQKITLTVDMGIKMGAPYLATSVAGSTNVHRGAVPGNMPLFFENHTSTVSSSTTSSSSNGHSHSSSVSDFPKWLVDLREFILHFPLNLIPVDDGPELACDGGDSPWTTCLMHRLAMNMSYSLGQEHAQLEKLSDSMRQWAWMYDARHHYFNANFIYSTRSSIGPVKNPKISKAKCAMITITHNEHFLLPIWIRYHLKHFDPGDIYIYDHLTDDGSTHPSKIPPGINFNILEGNKHKMPVRFRSRTIKFLQEKLLRNGYNCVLFSDVDELFVPDPLFYPGGLQEYLLKFVEDDKRIIVAGTAWEIAHISYGNGTEGTTEPPLNWDKSILAQRHYVFPDVQYNKPLLSKIPLSYTPGFHELDSNFRTYRPPWLVDPKLIMFHLRSLDYTFCMEREIQKHNMTKDMQEDELEEGMANHWTLYELAKAKGELCAFAVGCWMGEFKKNYTIVFDNTGVTPLFEMPSYWNLVDL